MELNQPGSQAPSKHPHTLKYVVLIGMAAVAVIASVLMWQNAEQEKRLAAQVAGFPRISSTTAEKNPSTACRMGVSSVTVLTPNGGETYQAGQQVRVTWSTCNASAQSALIGLWSSQTGMSDEIATVTNNGSAIVTLPLTVGAPAVSTASGNFYKIVVAPGGSPTIRDMSDSTFTIISSTPSGGGSNVVPGGSSDSSPNGGPSVTPGGSSNSSGGGSTTTPGGSSVGPVSSGCSAQTKVILVPEETSPDGINGSQIGTNQEIARFWLYSPCNIKIGALKTQAFGPYSIPNGQGQEAGYTFLGANRFSQFSAHNGFGTSSPVIGSVAYSGVGSSSDIIFSTPIQLQAGVPKSISISGKLKPASQVSGTVLNRAQFCIERPSLVTDMNGNVVQIQQPSNANGASGSFFGRFTCGDIFSIN